MTIESAFGLIGGTMGLCVGLSFLEIYSISRGLVQYLSRQINQRRMKQTDCQPEPAVKTVLVEEQKGTSKNGFPLARTEKRLAEIENFSSVLANRVAKIDDIKTRISKQGV